MKVPDFVQNLSCSSRSNGRTRIGQTLDFFEDNIWTFLRLEDIFWTKPGYGRTLIGQTLDNDKG